MADKSAILIAGPTASGKSALALKLAAETGGVIINADSMQVYAELRVLTARPSPAEEAEAPHRLYGVVSGAEPFSVGQWLAAAEAEIRQARAAAAMPILVGGTGLYFGSLLKGLAEIPEIPDEVRQRWRDLGETGGAGALRAALAARDPEMAARLVAGDPQRLIRALEVVDATDRSLADWQRDPPRPPLLDPETTCRIVLGPPRQTVYARADARVVRMLRAGALEEVSGLLALGLPTGSPVMKAIGVGELAAHLRGDVTLDAAMDRMRTATRRYAKRQLTWFRNRMADWQWREGARD
jgi:tRNA dimethylallyltransferase